MLAVVLALISATGYGAADFLAGYATRRDKSAIRVTLLVYTAGTLVMLVATLPLLVNGVSPPASSIAWGAVSGVGCGAGALFLAEGFRRSEFSVAAPLGAVIGAGGAALAGLIIGERLTSGAWAGILLALPAIFLVSASPSVSPRPQQGLSGAGLGVLAGLGCAVSYIGLAQAKTGGIWPLLAVQVACLAVTTVVAAVTRQFEWPRSGTGRWPSASSGVVGAMAAVAYLAAARTGTLAVVAVITALFPAATIALAATVERERIGYVRLAGLVVAGASVWLIAISGTSGL
jgi:drug/metabolite transporter (DMT)-like permease